MTQQQRTPPSVWQVIKSVLAAAFGVQSEAARLRDFQSGKPAPFIIAGLIFTVLFVLVLILVVRLVLRAAGA